MLMGAGRAMPSSRMPSRWISIAERMRRSTSARDLPVATHPGKIGHVGGPVALGPLVDHRVRGHRSSFSPACLRTFFHVPGGIGFSP